MSASQRAREAPHSQSSAHTSLEYRPQLKPEPPSASALPLMDGSTLEHDLRAALEDIYLLVNAAECYRTVRIQPAVYVIHTEHYAGRGPPV